MYLVCATYGQNLEYVKAVAKGSVHTHVARPVARGVYNLFTLQENPVQPGQKEFIVLLTDRYFGTPQHSK